MSIKVHHGAPGSYKTSGAIADDFVKAVYAGRTIITNVRGLDDEMHIRRMLERERFLIKKRLVPESFKLIHINTESHDDQLKLATFFHWAEPGAFLLIDEIGEIYRKDWTKKDYARLNYPGGPAAALNDNRPLDVFIAFQKHRHWNWDIVVTAPAMTFVPSLIQDTAEGAYLHVNKAKIGLKGIYLEVFHHPQTSGLQKSHEYDNRLKRIPKYVFALYQSTTTGKVSDTIAGRNVFMSTPVLLFFLLFFGFAFYIFKNGNPLDIARHQKQASSTSIKPAQSNKATMVTSRFDSSHQVLLDDVGESAVSTSDHRAVSIDDPVRDFVKTFDNLYYVGDFFGKHAFAFIRDEKQLVLYDDFFALNDIAISKISRCVWRVFFKSGMQIVTCAPSGVEPSDKVNVSDKVLDGFGV